LVEQRLKQMMIASVNDDYFGGRRRATLKPPCAGETPESTTDHNYFWHFS